MGQGQSDPSSEQRLTRDSSGGKSDKGFGRRPVAKEGESDAFSSRARTKADPKAAQEVIGTAPGRSYKKKSSAEIAGEVKQASQEAPEAMDRQRIPRAASDMARGYFENLAGPKDAGAKKGNNP